MHDVKHIADDFESFQTRLSARGGEFPELTEIVALNERRKELIQAYDTGRHRQRELSDAFRTQGAGNQPEVREELKSLGAKLKGFEAEKAEVEEALNLLLMSIPNVPDESVPRGTGEDDNLEVRQWGTPPTFDFEPKEHVELGEALGILDMEGGARISGSRFMLYRGAGSRLERALMMFMLDVHGGAHGYEEVFTPFLVLRHCMEGTGQLPKFEEDAFATTDGHFLIPTAEVPVTNLHRESILEEAELPRKYCAYSACFRREAGSYGKDTKGLTRLHQFQKVELVQFTKPEESHEALEALTGHAEVILQKLGLHYRVMSLCSGDLGFSSQKTYDLEVWLPGQNRYREISSCSNFGDFQARRAGIRYRPEDGGKPRFAHTLNGSGLAIGRTVMAIMENYQRADGSLEVPEALRPYMGGVSEIRV